MANVDIRLGYKDSAWFTANASLVLKEGQTVHLLQTGQYKIGDGTTVLSGLSFLGGGSTYTAGTGLTLTGNQFAIDSTVVTTPVLASYVPYTGATTNVNLGSNNIIAASHYGSTASGGTLTIDSTTHATKGAITF